MIARIIVSRFPSSLSPAHCSSIVARSSSLTFALVPAVTACCRRRCGRASLAACALLRTLALALLSSCIELKVLSYSDPDSFCLPVASLDSDLLEPLDPCSSRRLALCFGRDRSEDSTFRGTLSEAAASAEDERDDDAKPSVASAFRLSGFESARRWAESRPKICRISRRDAGCAWACALPAPSSWSNSGPQDAALLATSIRVTLSAEAGGRAVDCIELPAFVARSAPELWF